MNKNTKGLQQIVIKTILDWAEEIEYTSKFFFGFGMRSSLKIPYANFTNLSKPQIKEIIKLLQQKQLLELTIRFSEIQSKEIAKLEDDLAIIDKYLNAETSLFTSDYRSFELSRFITRSEAILKPEEALKRQKTSLLKKINEENKNLSESLKNEEEYLEIHPNIEEMKKFLKNHSTKNNTIYRIEFVEHKPNNNKLKVVINNDYKNHKEFKMGKYWKKLYELAEKQQLPINKNFSDYFNTNKSNPLYSKNEYAITKILTDDRAVRIIPNIDIKIISQKTFTQRKNEAT